MGREVEHQILHTRERHAVPTLPKTPHHIHSIPPAGRAAQHFALHEYYTVTVIHSRSGTYFGGPPVCSGGATVDVTASRSSFEAFREQKRGRDWNPGLAIAPLLFLLQGPELAVETLDQALAVLVGFLVGPEVPDLLGAQDVEPRGDLIDVLLVVVGDRERGRRHGLLRALDGVLDEPHAFPLEGEHHVVRHPRERETHHGYVAPLPEKRAVDIGLLLGLPEELLRHLLGELGLLAHTIYPGLDSAPGELRVQLLRLHGVVREDPGRLLRGPDHRLRGLVHPVKSSGIVRQNGSSVSLLSLSFCTYVYPAYIGSKHLVIGFGRQVRTESVRVGPRSGGGHDGTLRCASFPRKRESTCRKGGPCAMMGLVVLLAFAWTLCRRFFRSEGGVEGPLEEVGEAWVENLEVLGTGDAVAFVFEGEEFVGDILALQDFRNGGDVVLCDVWILQSLHDQERPLDVLYEFDRGPVAVAIGDILGGTAHHLLAVRPEVGACGVVVDHEIRHPADRGRCCDDLGFEVCDRPPRRVSAVGGACNAHAPKLCDAGLDESFDPTPYVFLLSAAPAVLFYGLLEGEPEPRAAPVVRRQHVEAARGKVLDLGVESILGVAGRAAVDQDDSSKFLATCSVEPTLYLHAVDRPPAEVFGGDEPLLVYVLPFRQTCEAVPFAILTVAHEVRGMEGIVVGADPAAIIGLGQRYKVAPSVL